MGKSVWDDLYDDPAEALEYKKRSALMISIITAARKIDEPLSGLAQHMGVSNNKAKNIMAGYMDKFDVPELSRICANLGADPESILQGVQ